MSALEPLCATTVTGVDQTTATGVVDRTTKATGTTATGVDRTTATSHWNDVTGVDRQHWSHCAQRQLPESIKRQPPESIERQKPQEPLEQQPDTGLGSTGRATPDTEELQATTATGATGAIDTGVVGDGYY